MSDTDGLYRWATRHELIAQTIARYSYSDQDELYELVMAVRDGVFPLAIKAALQMLGVCEPWSAPPVRALDDQAQTRLRERMTRLSLLRD